MYNTIYLTVFLSFFIMEINSLMFNSFKANAVKVPKVKNIIMFLCQLNAEKVFIK